MHPDDLLAEADDLEDYEAARRWTHRDDLPDLDAAMPARLRRAAFLRKLARRNLSPAETERQYDAYDDDDDPSLDDFDEQIPVDDYPTFDAG
jgi:hypothetical protein